MNVIFIDDDEDLNFLHKRMCARSKVIESYYIASGARQTLDYLTMATTPPNIIFVDINMPGMNGFEFIEEFEENFLPQFPDTLIYVLSSSVRANDRMKSSQCKSVKDFLIKPLTEEKLADICLQLVNL